LDGVVAQAASEGVGEVAVRAGDEPARRLDQAGQTEEVGWWVVTYAVAER
jgi:hypothetical protein